MGVHRVVLKSDKIPLDLYYLEVFASNGLSQVNSCFFVMVLLALDPPNDYEFNEHLFWELYIGVHRVVLKSDKIPLVLYYLKIFASNGHSQVNSRTFVMVLLINPMSTCLGVVHGCAQSCAEK